MQELDAVKNVNHTLQQELQAARVHHTELQRDSMKLVLQIVSKGLYHNSFSMRPDNCHIDTENAQDFVLVGKKKIDDQQNSENQPSTERNVDGCHSKTKMSPPCQSNTERPKGNSGAG